MKNIEFQVDNLTLKGNLFYPKTIKEKNPAILFIHGWTSEKKRSFQYAEALIKLGFIVMVFDMRGHGISDGDIATYTPKQFLKDCVSAYDFLSSEDGVDKENISIIGSSFGSYLGAITTTKRKIKNIVLRVPADYKKETFECLQINNSGTNPGVMEWRNIPKLPNETLALQAVHDFDGTILIIESEKDTIVPHTTIQNYINAVKDTSKLTHVVIKNAPHSIKDGPFKDEIERILVEWFKNRK